MRILYMFAFQFFMAYGFWKITGKPLTGVMFRKIMFGLFIASFIALFAFEP